MDLSIICTEAEPSKSEANFEAGSVDAGPALHKFGAIAVQMGTLPTRAGLGIEPEQGSGRGQGPSPSMEVNGGSGSRLCENAQQPTRRRIVFSIALSQSRPQRYSSLD
jgi:hypothetical protein